MASRKASNVISGNMGRVWATQKEVRRRARVRSVAVPRSLLLGAADEPLGAAGSPPATPESSKVDAVAECRTGAAAGVTPIAR